VLKNFQVPVDAKFHTKHIPVSTYVKQKSVVYFRTLNKQMEVRTKCMFSYILEKRPVVLKMAYYLTINKK
jgi:hypothetical protein